MNNPSPIPRPASLNIAFVFPGQGSQSIGMLAELAAAHPIVRDTFAEASEAAGIDLWKLSQDGPEAELGRTEFTQPALLAAGIAVWRAWAERGGAQPAVLAGHSLGEYAALVAAGALSLADGARLVRERGRLMQDAVPAGQGAMAAVLGADDALVVEVCVSVSVDAAIAAAGDVTPEVVVPANYNSPGQIVIGGSTAAVDRAIATLGERGVRKILKLAVSVPSHTPLMRAAADRLGEVMAELNWSTPTLPIVQNVDATARTDIDELQANLVKQLYQPVRWTDCVQSLSAAGATRIAECGPGKVLSGLVKRIDKSIEMRALGEPSDFDAALKDFSA